MVKLDNNTILKIITINFNKEKACNFEIGMGPIQISAIFLLRFFILGFPNSEIVSAIEKLFLQ
jgi:hypothetical protein